MRFEGFSFGSVRIDGVSYDHDIVIDRGEVRKRKKKASKKLREAFGHTPLSLEEGIPWRCHRLVVGTGNGALPVMKRCGPRLSVAKLKLLIVRTEQAIELLKQNPRHRHRHRLRHHLARNLLSASALRS